MIRLIIDTDVGADDAVAIMMALRHPNVQVEAITTVAGNVPVEQATRNALYVAELCGADVPIFEGMARPLLCEASSAQEVHGQDGLGDLGLEKPRSQPQPKHAVDALIHTIEDAAGEITLVTLGPLTNVASALMKRPDLASLLRDIYIMGGTANALGNVTPSAEFNIWADPEAAQMVLHSSAPVTMVGWELVWDDMLLDADDMARLRSSRSRCASFAVDCNRLVVALYERLMGRPVIALPDAIAVAMSIDPSICRREKLYVTVETTSDLTRGETVVDRWGVLNQRPNVTVCFDPDANKFKRMLYETLTDAGERLPTA